MFVELSEELSNVCTVDLNTVSTNIGTVIKS